MFGVEWLTIIIAVALQLIAFAVMSIVIKRNYFADWEDYWTDNWAWMISTVAGIGLLHGFMGALKLLWIAGGFLYQVGIVWLLA